MRIWLALLVAPILVLAQQSIAYATSGWECARQYLFAVHAIHAGVLIATVVATVLAWQYWRQTRVESRTNEVIAARHFLAGLAVASGAFSALVAAAMWIPAFGLSPCFN
ncbi:MAG: hypothetical protein ACM3X5_07050 [Bacillota bacterium]